MTAGAAGVSCGFTGATEAGASCGLAGAAEADSGRPSAFARGGKGLPSGPRRGRRGLPSGPRRGGNGLPSGPKRGRKGLPSGPRRGGNGFPSASRRGRKGLPSGPRRTGLSFCSLGAAATGADTAGSAFAFPLPNCDITFCTSFSSSELEWLFTDTPSAVSLSSTSLFDTFNSFATSYTRILGMCPPPVISRNHYRYHLYF